MIVYKDVLEKLCNAGYNLRRIREEKLLSQSTLTSIRSGKSITLDSLNIICKLTKLPISELVEYIED